MGFSITGTYGDTGKQVSYTTLNFRSVNYMLNNIDSSVRYTQKYLGHRWAFTVQSPPLLRSEAFQNINNRDRPGNLGTEVVPPGIGSTSGTASGTITVQLSSSTDPAYDYIKGSKTIGVSGGSGTLKKGDLIRFSDHSKVYQLTADTNLDGSSTDTISIFPGLFQTLTTSTVSYNNVAIKVDQVADAIELSAGLDGYFKYNVGFIEVI
jgi:hypothetical protein